MFQKRPADCNATMFKQRLTITRIVILTLVMLTTVVLFALGTLNYYHERNVRLTELQSDLRILSGQLSSSLALPMWYLDTEQIEKIIKSVMGNRNVFGIVVKGADGVSIVSACVRDAQWRVVSTKSDIQTKGLLFDRADLRSNGAQTGTVSVFITPRFAEEYLWTFLLGTSATIIALNICLVFVLFQFLNRMVIKPLTAIESYALNVGAGTSGEAPLSEARFFGELENVRRSFLQMTQSLAEAQQELVRKEKLAVLGRLAGIVGHEIRNPLGVMSNAVYFLKTVLADADDAVKEYLDIIKQEIDDSQRIVSELLDFSRTKPPEIVPTEPAALVSQSLGRCAISGNITVRTDVPETLPKLNVDPFQIRQVLQNLIANAVQAMPGGGTLSIGARFVSEFVEVSVTDTGEGIPPENMKKLFQPLFTTKTKGIGLGLVVCKNLIEANGGKIEVTSEPGLGSIFIIFLPLVKIQRNP